MIITTISRLEVSNDAERQQLRGALESLRSTAYRLVAECWLEVLASGCRRFDGSAEMVAAVASRLEAA